MLCVDGEIIEKRVDGITKIIKLLYLNVICTEANVKNKTHCLQR